MANIKFTAEEARKTTDFVIEKNKKEQLEEVLYGIEKAAKEGKYATKFHRHRITDYVKTALTENGFEVTKKDDLYVISWEAKQEKTNE